MTHDRILIATDNSEPADQATAEALTLAEAFDSALYAVYVLDTAESPPRHDDLAAESGLETKAGQALNGVISAAAERDFEQEVVTAVVRGQTSPAILEYADAHDIDLIVIGTHGRGGLDRVVIGSVAEQIVRESPVPVLTVRSE